jgi:hypothetical protein
MNEKEEDKQRKRSPNFPYSSVRDCVQLITKLHGQVRQTKVPIFLAFGHMGLSPKSSTTDRIRAALLSYKLTTEEIVNKEKYLRLTELSNRIVIDTREKERLAAYREAALNDQMVKKLWEKEWKRGLPNDDATIVSVLRIDYGFQDEAAKRFASVLKDNYSYCALASYYEVSDDEEGVENPPLDDNPPPDQKGGKKPPLEETNNLTRYPIPLDGKGFAYIYLPPTVTENDAEYIPDFVNLLLKKVRKASANEPKNEE